MKNYQFLWFILLLLTCSCTKDFLDKKPNKALLVPTTLADMQALLTNSENVFNIAPYLTLVAADDYYTTSEGWQAITSPQQRNSYLWAKEVYEGQSVVDWSVPFKQVFYANVVLDGVASIKNEDIMEVNRIKGAALFFRAWAYFKLAEQFCVPYDAKDADAQPGIMLHLTSNVNERPGRGTLSQLYKQILNDAKQSELLLPVSNGLKTNPNRVAALALLAKIYLSMENYSEALNYARRVMEINNKIINYNSLPFNSTRPLPDPILGVNEEVLFFAYSNVPYFFEALTFVDSDLYKDYATDDLRKLVFFKSVGGNLFKFRGSYAGLDRSNVFLGLALDEVYLIAAECAIRNGNVQEGITVLNQLLEKRWLNGSFKAIVETNPETALRMVLKERRKELVCRDNRWLDLRRLNKDPRFAVTLKRMINGQVYELPPGDNRYVFPIPTNELSDNILQNIR